MNLLILLKRDMNIPNAITLLRLPLLIIFIITFITQQNNIYINYYLSIILLLSCFTDILDGIVARKTNKITDLGRILDPTCDKLTQITICICLMISNPNIITGATVYILSDLLLIYCGLLLMKNGNKFVSADWIGKAVTIGFYVCIFGFLLLDWNLGILMCIIAGMSFIRLVWYIRKYLTRESNNNIERRTILNSLKVKK